MLLVALFALYAGYLAGCADKALSDAELNKQPETPAEKVKL